MSITDEAWGPPTADDNPWSSDGDDGEPPPDLDDPAYHEAVTASMPADPVEAAVARMNERYMVVNEAGKALIYRSAYDHVLKRSYYERITFEDLKKFHLDQRVRVPHGSEGKTVLRPVVDIWLQHPNRRKFIGGIIFDPSCRHARPDTLNLWEGFAVKPRPGSWGRLKDHILTIICASNKTHFDWLMGWMARLVQRPGEQGEVAVVMRGIEGCGKGTLAKVLLHILGQHGLAINNPKHLTGNFNGHLRDTGTSVCGRSILCRRPRACRGAEVADHRADVDHRG